MNKYIYIKEGQFLKDVLVEIPSNCIVYKTLTGIGATTLILESEWNVIVIVPNVPVIKGKCKKMNKNKRKPIIKGVYEGVTISSITDYLNSNVNRKKFLTTPESYFKIKEAIEDHPDYLLFQDFFLLFDECERLVQDVSFREKMLLPMQDFFSYNRKAMISATPIEFTDPQFKRCNFIKKEIKPLFKYSKDLRLIETNNILFSLRKFIDENQREPYFIFHNSTASIAQMIRQLKIGDESAVFCSEDSKVKLNGNNFKNVHSDLAAFKKFNFFTSRFFSAVDVEFRGNPTIIMLTDLEIALHSTIDPLSEAVQIVGRFRDFEDFRPKKEIVHITNFNPNIALTCLDELENDIKRGQQVHGYLKKHLEGATTLGAVKTLQELMKKIELSLCITPDSEINYYLKDNKCFEEKVKTFYLNSGNLIQGYKTSKHFSVIHKKETYAISDVERKKFLKSESLNLKSIYEILCPLLEEINAKFSVDPFVTYFEKDELRSKFPKYIHDLEIIGIEEAKRLKFSPYEIRKAVKNKGKNDQVFNFEFIDFLQENFVVGSNYFSSCIEKITKEGIQRYNLFKLQPGTRLLNKYFQTRRTTVKGKKVYRIEKQLVV